MIWLPWRKRSALFLKTKVSVDEKGNIFCFAMRKDGTKESEDPESKSRYLSALLVERNYEAVDGFFPALAEMANDLSEGGIAIEKANRRTIDKLLDGRGKATLQEVADLLHAMGLRLVVVPDQD